MKPKIIARHSAQLALGLTAGVLLINTAGEGGVLRQDGIKPGQLYKARPKGMTNDMEYRIQSVSVRYVMRGPDWPTGMAETNTVPLYQFQQIAHPTTK